MLLGCGEVCAISEEISEDEAEFLILLALPPLAFWFVLEVSSRDWLAIDVLQLMGAAVWCSNWGALQQSWSVGVQRQQEVSSVGVLER